MTEGLLDLMSHLFLLLFIQLQSSDNAVSCSLQASRIVVLLFSPFSSSLLGRSKRNLPTWAYVESCAVICQKITWLFSFCLKRHGASVSVYPHGEGSLTRQMVVMKYTVVLDVIAGWLFCISLASAPLAC